MCASDVVHSLSSRSNLFLLSAPWLQPFQQQPGVHTDRSLTIVSRPADLMRDVPLFEHRANMDGCADLSAPQIGVIKPHI